MKVDIRTEGMDLGAASRRYAERAVLMALGRFAPRVMLAAVSVDAPESTSSFGAGGVRVTVRLDGACKMVVVDSDHAFEAALKRTLTRARRCVERDLAAGWTRTGSSRLRRPSGAASGRRARAGRSTSATQEDGIQ